MNTKKIFATVFAAVLTLILLCGCAGKHTHTYGYMQKIGDEVAYSCKECDEIVKESFTEFIDNTCPGTTLDKTENVNYSNPEYGRVNSITWSNNKTKGERVAVIEATSINVGFSSGNVSVCVIIQEATENGKIVAKIVAWLLKYDIGQSYIGKIDGINKWYVGSNIADEIPMDSNKTTGATMTSTAINKAINAAADYARNVAKMGYSAELNALDNVITQLPSDYATAQYSALSTKNTTLFVPTGTTLKYLYTAVVGAQEIYIAIYNISNVQEAIVFTNTLYNDQRQIVYKSAGITTEIETAVMTTYLSATASITNAVSNGNTTTYTVVGLTQAGYVPGNYTLTVVVTDGAIASVEIAKSGFVPYGPSEEMTLSVVSALVGKTSANIDSASSGLTTGATQSGNIILNAAKLALAHYDANNGGAN